jgi:hypothetical protein
VTPEKLHWPIRTNREWPIPWLKQNLWPYENSRNCCQFASNLFLHLDPDQPFNGSSRECCPLTPSDTARSRFHKFKPNYGSTLVTGFSEMAKPTWSRSNMQNMSEQFLQTNREFKIYKFFGFKILEATALLCTLNAFLLGPLQHAADESINGKFWFSWADTWGNTLQAERPVCSHNHILVSSNSQLHNRLCKLDHMGM